MFRKWWFFIVICLSLGGCAGNLSELEILARENNQFDILISGGTIVDGTGFQPYMADVLVRNNRIEFIGAVDESLVVAKHTIDARNRIITPGFIDIHAHGDPLLLPQFKNFLAMGVTSICLGQDGFSKEQKDLRGWYQQVNDTVPGVNIIPMIGHSTLRVLSGANYNTAPTNDQLQEMLVLTSKNLESGAFGITTGLEYTPGFYAQQEELDTLAYAVSVRDGVIMSHMRNEDDDKIEASLDELLTQGRYSRVHVSHLKVVYGKGSARADEILNKLQAARERGVVITADVYPYNASYTGIGILFPNWAKPPNNYQAVLNSRRDELLEHIRNRVEARNGPGATVIGTGEMKGWTLNDLAFQLKVPYEVALVDSIGPGGASAAYFVMDEELQTRLLLDSLVAISSDGSTTMHHPRGHGAFAKIISKFVIKDQVISIEEAVRKMSGLPASILGITDRGSIAVGNKADILVFRPEDVRDRATYEKPQELARGFEYVIVNGELALEKQQFSDQRYGKVLLKTEGPSM